MLKTETLCISDSIIKTTAFLVPCEAANQLEHIAHFVAEYQGNHTSEFDLVELEDAFAIIPTHSSTLQSRVHHPSISRCPAFQAKVKSPEDSQLKTNLNYRVLELVLRFFRKYTEKL